MHILALYQSSACQNQLERKQKKTMHDNSVNMLTHQGACDGLTLKMRIDPAGGEGGGGSAGTEKLATEAESNGKHPARLQAITRKYHEVPGGAGKQS
jgi:hypothetical protein